MYIVKSMVMPNGVTCTIHKLGNIIANYGGNTTITKVTVNSFAGESSAAAAWQDVYDVPVTVYTSGDIVGDTLDYLVDTGSAFDGGTLTADATVADVLAQTKTAEVFAKRKRVIEGNCPTTFGIIYTDADHVQTLTMVGLDALRANASSSTPTEEYYFQFADAPPTNLDVADTLAVVNTFTTFLQAANSVQDDLSNQIAVAYASSDPETNLNAIDIEGASWPSNS